MKLVKLDKDYDIKLKSQVTNFLSPDYIYIPIKDNNLSFSVNEEIKKGSKIFDSVYSPISGKVLGVKTCTLYNGKIEKCLVLANDYQEKMVTRIATRKRINNLTKEEYVEDLKNIEAEKILNKKNIKHIVISGIDDEPYIANEIFIQKENTKIILETIDSLLNLYKACEAIIVIKNTDGENIEAYTNFLGTYKNIDLRLIEDLYLIGKEENLINKLNIKEDYLFLKSSEVYALYHNLKKRKPMFEKYITITGDAVEEPQVFNVKLGSKVMDIINSNYEINLDDYDVYVNGLMQGIEMSIQNLIVTAELDGIVIMKKTDREEVNCIKCGKCIEICPINSNPLLAYKEGIKIDCINCGLCSYICPSYINLRKYILGDKNE